MIYWRVLNAPPATPYGTGFWFALVGDLVQLAGAKEYPTAGPILNRNEIEWVVAQ